MHLVPEECDPRTALPSLSVLTLCTGMLLFHSEVVTCPFRLRNAAGPKDYFRVYLYRVCKLSPSLPELYKRCHFLQRWRMGTAAARALHSRSSRMMDVSLKSGV